MGVARKSQDRLRWECLSDAELLRYFRQWGHRMGHVRTCRETRVAFCVFCEFGAAYAVGWSRARELHGPQLCPQRIGF